MSDACQMTNHYSRYNILPSCFDDVTPIKTLLLGLISRFSASVSNPRYLSLQP